MAKGQNLMAAIIVQAAIGYFQYFTGVPALLVGVHVAGATLIWVMILRLYLEVHQPILEKHYFAAKNST
jgi:heme A synthase